MAEQTPSSGPEPTSDTADSNAVPTESVSPAGENAPISTTSGSSAAPISTEPAPPGHTDEPAQPDYRGKDTASTDNRAKPSSGALRSRIATAVWLLAVVAALILAVGALLIALDANPHNAAVGRVLDVANRIDWFFWKILEMKDRTQNHLVNWGLAAVAYLVVGRLADRIIRP